MMPLENKLFQYIDKTATPAEIQEVEQWLSASPKNRKYLQELLTVHFESNHLKTYVHVDVESEWNHFLLKKSEPLKPIEKSISRRKIFYFAAAACAAFLLCFQLLLNEDTPLKLINSGNQSMTINLPDESKVLLYPKSTIEYDEVFTNLKERRILLDGNAKFEVVSNPQKPFVVETNDFETTVLGTIFTIESNGKNKGISVHEGSVSAIAKSGGRKIVLEKGNRVYFDENGFSDIEVVKTAIPADPKKLERIQKEKEKSAQQGSNSQEVVAVQTPDNTLPDLKENTTTIKKKSEDIKKDVLLSKYTLKDVFSFLDKRHVEKDKFSKSRKCKPSSDNTIALNLQEDLASILNRIEAEYIVVYEDAPCDGCFKIKSIEKK